MRVGSALRCSSGRGDDERDAGQAERRGSTLVHVPHVMRDRLIEVVVVGQAAVFQNRPGIADLIERGHAVRDDDGASGFQARMKNVIALLAEIGVADGRDLVNQIGVEGNGHRHAKGQAGFHPG